MSKIYITHQIIMFEKYKVIDIVEAQPGLVKHYQSILPQYKIGFDFVDTKREWFVP